MSSQGNQVERFRSRRLEARAKIQGARSNGSPAGTVLAGTPHPWLSLNSWQGRIVFDCPIWEMRLASGMHLAAVAACNNYRVETIATRDSRSESLKREMERRRTRKAFREVEGPRESLGGTQIKEVEQELENQDGEQDERSDGEPDRKPDGELMEENSSQDDIETVEHRSVQPLIGEEAHYFEDSRIKMLVFVTADVEYDTLADLHRVSKAAGRKLTSDFEAGLRNTVVGFAVLTSIEQRLHDITKRSRRSDYPASGTFAAPFKAKTTEEVYEHFLGLTGPVDGVPTMFGIHAFVILDDQTADDRKTCLLVSDNDGRLESRRVEFEVALFHLVCLEALMLGLAQCGDLEEQVLTAWLVKREQHEHEEQRRRELEQYKRGANGQSEESCSGSGVDNHSEKEEMEVESDDASIASRVRKRKKTT